MAVLVTIPAVVLGCSSGEQKSDEASSSSTATTTTSSTPAALLTGPACGDGPALLAGMTPREKLAQLLMVGVADAADARDVVTTQHVGGILIGSKTDLTMLSDSTIPDIANAGGPLPLAVGVDEEGGRVSRLKSLIGVPPSPRVLAATDTPEQVHDVA